MYCVIGSSHVSKNCTFFFHIEHIERNKSIDSQQSIMQCLTYLFDFFALFRYICLCDLDSQIISSNNTNKPTTITKSSHIFCRFCFVCASFFCFFSLLNAMRYFDWLLRSSLFFSLKSLYGDFYAVFFLSRMPFEWHLISLRFSDCGPLISIQFIISW